MKSVTVPVIAGIIVSLLNKYVLDFKWCTVVKNWCEGDDDWCNNTNDEDGSDMTPSSSTAINTDTIMTHHIVTHVH